MDQGGEGDALEIQKVEVFERQGADAPWHPVGEGTVLWQAGAEGRVEQRLLVMEPDGSGEWARELEALDFPDPNLAINCLPEDSVLTWRSGGQTREVALAFKSQEGCLQVWEDVQALQELAFHGGAGDGSMTDFLDQFADGADGGGPLPPPSEDSLSQVGMRLSTCPPGLMPLLLQQLIGAEAAAAAAAAAVSGYAQAFGNAGAPPAVGGTARGIDASSAAAAAGEGSDYVSQLCAIAIRLAEGGGHPDWRYCEPFLAVRTTTASPVRVFLLRMSVSRCCCCCARAGGCEPHLRWRSDAEYRRPRRWRAAGRLDREQRPRRGGGGRA